MGPRDTRFDATPRPHPDDAAALGRAALAELRRRAAVAHAEIIALLERHAVDFTPRQRVRLARQAAPGRRSPRRGVRG